MSNAIGAKYKINMNNSKAYQTMSQMFEVRNTTNR